MFTAAAAACSVEMLENFSSLSSSHNYRERFIQACFGRYLMQRGPVTNTRSSWRHLKSSNCAAVHHLTSIGVILLWQKFILSEFQMICNRLFDETALAHQRPNDAAAKSGVADVHNPDCRWSLLLSPLHSGYGSFPPLRGRIWSLILSGLIGRRRTHWEASLCNVV